MDLFDDRENFKNKIEDHRSINVPDNLAWDKMGPEILEGVKKQKKKERRKFIWWWIIGFGMLGLSFLGWHFSKQIDHEIFQNVEKHTDVIPRAEAIVTESELVPENKLALENEDKINNENIDSNQRKSSQQKKEKTVFNSNQKGSKIVPNTNAQSNDLQDTVTDSNDLGRRIDFESTDKTLNENFLNQGNKQIALSSKTEEKQAELIVNKLKEINTNTRSSRADIVAKNLPLLYSLLYDKTNKVSITPNYAKIKSNSYLWQLEMSGGPNFWSQGLIGQELNKDINTTQIGWHIDTRIKRQLGKLFSIKLGLQLQNLRYKSAFENEELVSLYRPNTVDFIFIDSFTGEQRITFRDYITALESRKFQHFNKHSTLSMPILFGLTARKKRWNYSAHSGLALQFFQRDTGRIALLQGEVIDLPDENLYPNTLKISYLVETQIEFQVTTKIGLFSRLSYQSYLSNWLSSGRQLQFKQRPNIFNSTLGISWSF